MSKKIFNGLKIGLNIYGLTITLVLSGIFAWYIAKVPEVLFFLQKNYKLPGSIEGAIFPIRAILLIFVTGLLSATVSCLVSFLSKN